MIKLGRKGTTTLTNGVNVLIRRTLTNDTLLHPSAWAEFLGLVGSATVSSTTVNADSASGQNALNVASITNFAAGDLMIVGGNTAREEYCRVAKTAAGVLTVDSPLKFTHTAAQADTVINRADVFSPIWCPGGATYEVVIDYADDSAGSDIQVVADAQTYDSDTTV
jgi:hypothetical protein